MARYGILCHFFDLLVRENYSIPIRENTIKETKTMSNNIYSIKRDYKGRDNRRVNPSPILSKNINSIIYAMKFTLSLIIICLGLGSFLIYMLSF